MGTSQDESIQIPTSLEHEHDIANGDNFTALSQPPVEGDNVLSLKKELNPSTSCSSSPNESLDNPFAENDYKHGVSNSSSSNLLFESPTIQVMERSANESHRIPSSVFETDKSSDPLQWSVSSSESLFSIQIGNMSITRDYSLWCSDERGEASVDVDGPLPSTIPSPLHQASNHSSVKLRAMEPPLDTVKEDSRESEDQNHEKTLLEGRISHFSDESGASVKSFAFPILTGDLDKDSPGKLGCSDKLFSEQKQPEPAPLAKQETEPLPDSEPKEPQDKQPAVQTKWFYCFPCCP